jgi:hypothetical protein
LDQAIGSTPPSTIDVDGVVATARRRSVRRRWAVAGAAGGTALAAVGVVAALMLSSAGPLPSTSRVEAGDSSSATQGSGAAPVRAGETRDQAEQRIVAALTDGLTAALPGVRLSDGPTGAPGVSLSFMDSPVGYNTDTVLTTATVPGEVFYESWAGGTAPAAAEPTDWPSDQPPPPKVITWFTSCADMPTAPVVNGDGFTLVDDCVDSVGPDGQKVVSVTERCPGCPGQPIDRHDVYVTWNNARVGMAIVTDTKRGGPTGAHAPLLTLDQLIAIATNPDLTVTS